MTISTFFPSYFSTSFLFLNLWQWTTLLIAFVVALCTQFLVKLFIEKILVSKFQKKNQPKIHRMISPFGLTILLTILLASIHLIDLSHNQLAFLHKAFIVAITLSVIWLFHRIIDFLSYHFSEKVQRTDSKSDDLLVPIIQRGSYIALYSIGLIFLLERLGTDVKSLLAGLGIGGLAFAFAAKDMLSNIFGSLMIIIDRPFDIGDIISTDNIDGTVESVGFRSTRIRSFNDALISVPNGVLANLTIKNQGKRRFRRLTSKIGIEYSTSPELIEAFCDGIREIIISHPWTRKDKFNVYLSDLSSSSLDILVHVYWLTDAYERELNEKHRFLIDIIRLASDLGVGFAFPSTSIYMIDNQNVKESSVELNKAFDKAKTTVNTVIQNPLSQKDPSSNIGDAQNKEIGL